MGVFKKIISVLLAFSIIAFFFIVFKTFQPHYLKQIQLTRGKKIRIDRDNFGIPTLHVTSLDQYLYALGTVYSEDRLFQLTMRAYSVQGRLSQFLGEKTLMVDRFMRELNLKGWAEKRVQRLSLQNPEEYSRMCLMADGINDRVDKMMVLPQQFYLTGIKWEPFTINHIFYLDILVEWSLSMNIMDEYVRSVLLAHYTKDQIDWILPNKKENWAFKSIPIVSDDEIPERLRSENVKKILDRVKFDPLSVESPVELEIIEFLRNEDATNTWAISGQFTQSGFPIIANDPHLEASVPSQFYQAKVNYTADGKSIFYLGRSTPGNPRLFGKNNYFADGISIGHGDNQDLFRQNVVGYKYLVDGVWRDVKIRNETILVKTSSGIRRDQYLVKQTHRGPIIHYLLGGSTNYKMQEDSISVSWTGFNSQWLSMSCMYRNFLIDSFEGVRNYLQNCTQSFYSINMLVITADNHIISQQAGIHPIRRNPQSGYYIKDGSTTQHDWIGIVPAEDRIHIYDPPKGYIIHANNKHAQSQFYGGYLDYTTYTARADRIDELIREEIKSGRKINIQFAKTILYDTVDVYCRQILPQIITVVEQSKDSLEGFDCDFRSESHKATQYEAFIYKLYHLMKPIKSQKTSLINLHYMQQGIFNYIHFAFRGDLQKQETMRQAWKQGIIFLESHFKTNDRRQWEWGKLHTDAGKHHAFKNSVLSYFYDLNSSGFGNFHTPNVGKMQKQQFGNFQTTQRAVIRTIFTFGADQDQWCIDSGISQSIFSKHYSDQWRKLISNQMIPTILTPKYNQQEQM